MTTTTTVTTTSSEPETVYIVDDDPGVITALSRLTRTAGFRVEAYSSATEFLERHRNETPGCAILDVSMGDWCGLDVHRKLVEAGCGRPIIYISGQSDLYTGVQAMKAGAIDFLMKPISADDLFRAIAIAIERDHSLRQTAEQVDTIKKRLDTLSPREFQVFEHVVRGRLNKQIAGDLGIVEKTAKVHRGRMMSKMGALNVASLVHMAERMGYSSLPPNGSRTETKKN